MYRFTSFPHWVIAIFSFFCLVQVRSWFEEIIESFNVARNNFVFMGQRFFVLPNRSFIIDESLNVYGLHVNDRHKLN